MNTIIGAFICVFRTHVVSDEDEDELYAKPKEVLKTMCQRCHMPLVLTVDCEDGEYYNMIEDV